MDKEKLIAIVSKLERKDGRLDGNKTKEIEKYLTKEEIALIDKSIDAKSLIEKVFLVSKRLWEVPICPTCGKKLRFTGKYRKFCSVRCAKLNKDFTDNQIKKSIEKYGTRWPSQSSEVKEKIKSTCLNRYGVTTTLIEKKTKEKIKETWIDKHGVDNPWKNAKVQEKRKQTWIDKYGVDNPLKDDDVKRTHQESCLKKYGVKHIGECELIRQKIKKTMLEKHGVASFLEIPWVIEKSHNKETIAKSNVTKRKNHTFNTSKSEEKTFEILKERYPDVIRQYKSEKYPFCCDFYVPSIDTYIECNYHWTHGGHPYNEEKDKEKLNFLKSKNTRYYFNAIDTWVRRDVGKRSIAKINNLNFVEFFSFEDFLEFMKF